MTHELKIIITMEEDKPLLTSKTVVYLDDQSLGAIQDLKLRAKAGSMLIKLKIIFPNLQSTEIDPAYKHSKSSLLHTVREQIEKLSKFPGIKVGLKDLF